MAVTTETFEAAYDAARARLAPAVADLAGLARERGGEVVRAARGVTPAHPPRWPFAAAGFAGGVAVGALAVVAVRRMFPPLPMESGSGAVPDGEYVRTLPDVTVSPPVPAGASR